MQTIQLEGSENITVIRDLLEHATDSQVVLYVPRGCEALENNEVNLKVLRRWADNLALRVALVIEHRNTAVIARDAGFVVLPSLEAAQKANLAALDHKRRRRAGLPLRASPGLSFSNPFQPAAKRSAQPARRSNVPRPVVAAAMVGVLLLALLVLLPSATVTLKPVTEPVDASMEMTGVSGLQSVDYGQAKVPARSVSIELAMTDTIATTEMRDVPDGHAEGSVVFANKTTIPVTVTKGTVVRTSFGENLRFYTMSDVWLPGELHRTVRTGILAAEPGPGGNVPALTINTVEGELAAQVDVLNDERTSGGTVRRMATVGGDDQVRLRAKLTKRVQDEAYKQLISALQPSEFVPPDSLAITVVKENLDHKVGDAVDVLGLEMKVRVTGLAVDSAAGEQLLVRLLEQRMKPGFGLVPNSVQFERGSVLAATQDQARFNMSARAATAPAINARTVQRLIAGKTVQEAKAALVGQFKLSTEPKITLGGSLLGRLPWWGGRIRLQVSTG